MRKFALFMLLLSFCHACDDIFEIDLSNEEVFLIAPSDGISTNENGQTFYWEKIEGASNYNLQIVSPGFSSISKFVLDTMVVNNSFFFTLIPGEYEWRVNAKNASSKTEYSTYKLTISN